MAQVAPLARYIDIAYIMIHMTIMAGMPLAEETAPSGASVELAAPKDGTFTASTLQSGWSVKDTHDINPNTLSTTAHIHSLSFRP